MADDEEDESSECDCSNKSCSQCRSSLPSSSSSCSLLSFDSYPVQDYDKLWRVFTASVKGFVIGSGLKGGLAVFALLTRLNRRRLLPASKKTEMASVSADLSLALKETLRYGLFLGTYAGTFVTLDEVIAGLGGHQRHDSDGKMESIARWSNSRAINATYREEYRSHKLGDIHPDACHSIGIPVWNKEQEIRAFMQASYMGTWRYIPYVSVLFPDFATFISFRPYAMFQEFMSGNYKNFPTFITKIMCFLVRSAYILKPDSLPPSYKSFLNKHGGKHLAILNGVKDIACGQPFTNLEAIEKYYNSTGVDIKLDPQMKVPCSIVHGHQSCGTHFFSFLLQAFKRALPVYLPVYLIPALIVHRQSILKRPYPILWKGLFGTARSSLFLSGYCSSAWIWTCFLFRIFKRCNVPMVVMGTFPPGLALAIEKKSRRIEISLYCFARALESFFTCMADLGYLPEQSKKLKRADVLVFSISTAIIMHCYAIERDVFRSKYLNVLDWVFGIPLPPYESTPRKKK